MRVYLVWEHFGTLKWIVNIYLTKQSAEKYLRDHVDKHDLRIETVEVLA